MKKWRFKKGINVVHVPFILHPFSTWEEQIREQTGRLYNEYEFGKNVEIGFNISDVIAEIEIRKI